VRDNRQNFVKISWRALSLPVLCYLIHAVFIAGTKGGAVLGFDTRTEAIPLPILAAWRIGGGLRAGKFKI